MGRYDKSIELLNRAVADELAAVHQYMYFHFHCDDLGYDPLAVLFKRTAIEEMLHIERLAERILFLKGDVRMVASAEVKASRDPAEMLALAKQDEIDSAYNYNLWANEAGAAADAGTKRIFEDLVGDEERHADQYEVQQDNIERFGVQFLALQSIERSKALGQGGGGEPPA